MLLSTLRDGAEGASRVTPGGSIAYGNSAMTRPGKLVPIFALVAVVFFVAVYR